MTQVHADGKRGPATVLGRVIGTTTGQDNADEFVIVLLDFKPAPGIELPSGDLVVDLNSGRFEQYDDASGELLSTIDIVGAIHAAPFDLSTGAA